MTKKLRDTDSPSSPATVRIDKSGLPDTIKNVEAAIIYFPPIPYASQSDIVARHGSVENFWRAVIATPKFWSNLVSNLIQEPKNMEAVVEQVTALANCDKWMALAASDPDAFRTELAANISAYKSALKALCRISTNRPKNYERGMLIRLIKDSKPDLSFGQVAKEYRSATGKPMTPKDAERFYKRESTSPMFVQFEPELAAATVPLDAIEV